MILERLRNTVRLVPRFSDPDEALFCRRWLQNLEHYLYGTITPVTSVFDLIVAAAAPYIAHPMNVLPMRVAHALHFLLVVASPFLLQRPRALRTVGFLAALSYLFGYGYITWTCSTALKVPRHELLSATALLSISIIYVQGCAFDKKLALAFSGLAVVTAFVAMSGNEVGYLWAGLNSCLVLIAWYFYAARIERTLEEARREFRVRGKIAPTHIVRKTGGSEADLIKAFEPLRRPCVCISSDWRNYQRISETFDAARLSRALNAYYNFCYTLLHERFPEGNYYTDWIADELFIVVYADGDVAGRDMVNAALELCHDLVRRKQAFFAEHGLPEAIDVGVSYGVALVGMMGPDHFRKATALGEIPGRARRLQSTGKLLRARLGDEDRVIFDKDVLMKLTAPFQVKSFAVASGEVLRDLPDSEVFYVQPVDGAATTPFDGQVAL